MAKSARNKKTVPTGHNLLIMNSGNGQVLSTETGEIFAASAPASGLSVPTFLPPLALGGADRRVMTRRVAPLARQLDTGEPGLLAAVAGATASRTGGWTHLLSGLVGI